MQDDFIDELKDLLAANKLIDAVKRYREKTGCDLTEAKNFVESLKEPDTLKHELLGESGFEKEIVKLLFEERKIEAIKIYRKKYGGDLKAAKLAVEQLGEKHGVPISGGIGCMGVILLGLGLWPY